LKCAVKREGFCPDFIRQLASQTDRSVWAAICLPNESCAIGDELPTSLKNYLTRCFRKYAQVYGASVNLQTGEVVVDSSINQYYNNNLSSTVADTNLKKEILAQLARKLWRYADATKIDFWIAGLDEELEAENRRQTERSLKKRRRPPSAV
jgi:hypothetical protein